MLNLFFASKPLCLQELASAREPMYDWARHGRFSSVSVHGRRHSKAPSLWSTVFSPGAMNSQWILELQIFTRHEGCRSYLRFRMRVGAPDDYLHRHLQCSLPITMHSGLDIEDKPAHLCTPLPPDRALYRYAFPMP